MQTVLHSCLLTGLPGWLQLSPTRSYPSSEFAGPKDEGKRVGGNILVYLGKAMLPQHFIQYSNGSFDSANVCSNNQSYSSESA